MKPVTKSPEETEREMEQARIDFEAWRKTRRRSPTVHPFEAIEDKRLDDPRHGQADK